MGGLTGQNDGVRKKTVRRKLREAIGGSDLVRIDRVSRPSQTVEGFVVSVGKRWVLIQQTMDGGFFDGHVAIRISEVRRVREDSSFESAFARTRPEWPPTQPRSGRNVELDTTAGLFASLASRGQLFGIERNKKYDATWIGVLDEVAPPWLYMREVRPDATWHEEPRGYRLRTITLALVGTHYLQGLTSIAEPAPAAS
ncbi:hypothetical protein LG315_08490 [Microbacterium marinum]|uniref:hypothetical protein n=1 Tax=Microbacterium marinum TaxID=421115 RepID=UPI00384FB3BF